LIVDFCRFSLDLDIAAPKITIPTDFFPDGKNQCKLLVDLGYLTLQTEVCKNCLGVLSDFFFPVSRQNRKRYICATSWEVDVAPIFAMLKSH
jgi:hypothetical protein